MPSEREQKLELARNLLLTITDCPSNPCSGCKDNATEVMGILEALAQPSPTVAPADQREADLVAMLQEVIEEAHENGIWKDSAIIGKIGRVLRGEPPHAYVSQPATPQGQGDVPRYRVVDFDEAVKLGIAKEDERSVWEFNHFVVATIDGKVEEIGCDGGEPEDQILTRDWQWVVRELNRAYEAGKPLATQPHVQSPTVAQLCGLIKAENNEAGIYMIECPVCLGCKEIAVGMKVTFDFCEPDCWLGNALKAGGVS